MVDLTEIADEELVARALEGDDFAFEELYGRHINGVYQHVRFKIPTDAVDDVVQEIFVSVSKALPSFQENSTFKTWLYTIMRRRVADFYKKRNSDEVPLDTQNPISGGGLTNLTDDRIILENGLAQLPEPYRDLILLRYANGWTFREIAEFQGEHLEAVKSKYRRAIDALREELIQNDTE